MPISRNRPKTVPAHTAPGLSHSIPAAMLLLFFPLLLLGCGAGPSGTAVKSSLPAVHTSQGAVFGGQQPIAGASVALYVAGTSGYGAPSTNILDHAVVTTRFGNFDLGTYTCTAGQQVFIVATGGDPGGGVNASVALMAALGDCTNLGKPNYFININEVTTVAGVYALAPFMSGLNSIGTSPDNVNGLIRAFNSAGKLANTGNGKAPGPTLAPSAIAPVAEIYTLGNILAACINSSGTVSKLPNACGQLFSLTTTGTDVPTDTIGALLSIVRRPATNVASLYRLVTPSAPFQPQLAQAPADWTISIRYTAGGFNAPSSAAVDGQGSIWFANAGNSTVTVLSQAGVPQFTLYGNGLSGPQAIAIDSGGKAWVSNRDGNSVSVFAANGAAVSGSPFSASGSLSGPSGLAFDALGHLWIANSAGNTLTELDSSGALAGTVSLPFASPAVVVVDPK